MWCGQVSGGGEEEVVGNQNILQGKVMSVESNKREREIGARGRGMSYYCIWPRQTEM